MAKSFSKILKDYQLKWEYKNNEMSYVLGISERMFAYYEKGDYDGNEKKVAIYLQKLANHEQDRNKPNFEKLQINATYKTNNKSESNTSSNAIVLSNDKGLGIPVYDIEYSAGKGISLLEAREHCYPVAHLNIPEVKGCDMVVLAKGDSMQGVIDDRDWMAVKQLHDWREWIPKNYPYAIVTKEQLLVKYAKRKQSENFITIMSANKFYEDDEIPIKLILEVWQVRCVLPFSKIKTFI